MIERLSVGDVDARGFSVDPSAQRIVLQTKLISFLHHEPGLSAICQDIAMDLLRDLEARWVHLAQLQPEATLASLGTFGLSSEVKNSLNGIPIWEPTPMSIAARTGQTVVYIDKVKSEISLPTCLEVLNQHPTVVASPLNLSIKTIGVLTVGFLPSDAPAENLASSVESIAEILVLYLAGWLAPFERLNNEVTPENHPSPMDSHSQDGSLSQRQMEILGLLAEGFTYDQISNRIGFSHSTVRMELMHIYRAFGVNSRAQAVQWAKERGFIPESIPNLVTASAPKSGGGGISRSRAQKELVAPQASASATALNGCPDKD